MDTEVPETPASDNKNLPHIIMKLVLTLLFQMLVFLFLSFLVGLLAVFMEDLSFTSPISLPSHCRIVSSSVDLRSSKVCELGLLNHKSEHVFHPFERSKYNCRFDYYWASVFKVEYIDHFSGQTRLGLAEAPNEALPLDCRPSFSAAWLTKDKFKVNESYGCWYTAGMSKVKLNQEGLFRCQTKDPSAVEKIRRYYILSTNVIQSTFTSRGRAKYLRWETLAGLIAGFSTSLISVGIFRVLHQMKSCLPKICGIVPLSQALRTVHVKRACFLVIYFSAVGYMIIRYGKMLGVLKV